MGHMLKKPQQFRFDIGDTEAFAGLFLDIAKPAESKISNAVLSYLIQR